MRTELERIDSNLRNVSEEATTMKLGKLRNVSEEANYDCKEERRPPFLNQYNFKTSTSTSCNVRKLKPSNEFNFISTKAINIDQIWSF